MGRGRCVWCLAPLLVGGALVSGGQAAAQMAPPTFVLSPTEGEIGATVQFQGSECDAGDMQAQRVRIYFGDDGFASSQMVAQAPIESGTYSGSFVVPATSGRDALGNDYPVVPGAYEVIVDCSTFNLPDRYDQAAFTVTSSSVTSTSVTTPSTAPSTAPPTSAVTAPPSTATSIPDATTSSSTTTTTTAFTPPATPPADAAPATGLGSGSATAGGGLTIDEPGFVPGETVVIVLYSEPVVLATLTADATGSVKATVKIPADTAPGTHTLTLFGETVVKKAAVQVAAAGVTTTTARPASLARTGPGAAGGPGSLVLGAALAAGGGALVLVARERRLAAATHARR